MVKIPRKAYTLEFQQEAVRLVESGQRISEAARSLGVVEQTLSNWVRAHRLGKLRGAGNRAEFTAEQIEIRRLRAELARVTMERDILGKATAFFAKGQKCSKPLSIDIVLSGRSVCSAACSASAPQAITSTGYGEPGDRPAAPSDG